MSLPATRPRRYQKSGLYCRPTRLADLPAEVAEARRVRQEAFVSQLGSIVLLATLGLRRKAARVPMRTLRS